MYLQTNMMNNLCGWLGAVGRKRCFLLRKNNTRVFHSKARRPPENGAGENRGRGGRGGVCDDDDDVERPPPCLVAYRCRREAEGLALLLTQLGTPTCVEEEDMPALLAMARTTALDVLEVPFWGMAHVIHKAIRAKDLDAVRPGLCSGEAFERWTEATVLEGFVRRALERNWSR